MNDFAKYYKNDLKNLVKRLVPKGVESEKFDKNTPIGKKKYEYIILKNSLAEVEDVQEFLIKIKSKCKSGGRVVVIYFNFFWKPILDLATKFGFRKNVPENPNWLTETDINNLFELMGFEKIISGQRLLIPYGFPLVSKLINSVIGQLPIINRLCLTTYQIFRLPPKPRDYSVSIIIPARNEEGNIKGIVRKIPKFGTRQEVIFVEGHSRDHTWEEIQTEVGVVEKYGFDASVYKQKGKGKADAVRLGFSRAKGEILIILDADLTVPPKDLTKFYNALASGKADFANGSRLVYPMESQAMQSLNYFFNNLFGILFSYLLGQEIKDTLCGTKALFKTDYERIVKNRRVIGDFDPFGDFDLLFGASMLNLKIRDIPVRYKERVHGRTNISRFWHGILLFKMSWFAAKKLKFR